MATVTNHSRYLSSHLDAARPGQAGPVTRRRPLGQTGLWVGEVGLGLAGLARTGLGAVPDAEAAYAIGTALDMQASLVDVAPTYGEGRALALLGRAMRGRRGQAQVCLKAGYTPQGADFSAKGIRASVESSLKALGTDHADVLLLHNPPASALAPADPAWAELAALKKAGKARAIGATLTSPDQLKAALEKAPVEVLQFPLNVFCQDNAALLGACEAKGVGVIANRPLDSGWLSGRYGAGHLFLDERRRWSRADKERREALQLDFEAADLRPGITPAQAALQFVLSFPQVSCAIPGASAWQQVVGNVDAAQLRLDPAVIARLKDLWDKKVKSSPLPL